MRMISKGLGKCGKGKTYGATTVRGESGPSVVMLSLKRTCGKVDEFEVPTVSGEKVVALVDGVSRWVVTFVDGVSWWVAPSEEGGLEVVITIDSLLAYHVPVG
jgi:hypothetical protein